MLAPYGDEVAVVGTAQGDPEMVMVPDTEEDADVMLIDAFARRAAGIDAAVKVLAQDPPFTVAVFTDNDDLRLLLQALRMGVCGYLLKSSSPEDLVEALKRLGAGETVITPALATEAALLAARALDLGGWPGAHLGLTRREAELLTLLGEGMSPRQAAEKMDLSWQTVRTHTRNLYRKLGVSDRASAVAIAWREGLGALTHSARSLDHHLLDQVRADSAAGGHQPRGLGIVVVGIGPPVADGVLDPHGMDGESTLAVEVHAQEVLVAGDAGGGEGLVAVGPDPGQPDGGRQVGTDHHGADDPTRDEGDHAGGGGEQPAAIRHGRGDGDGQRATATTASTCASGWMAAMTVLATYRGTPRGAHGGVRAKANSPKNSTTTISAESGLRNSPVNRSDQPQRSAAAANVSSVPPRLRRPNWMVHSSASADQGGHDHEAGVAQRQRQRAAATAGATWSGVGVGGHHAVGGSVAGIVGVDR